jgi:hypothetical protein
MRRAATGSGGGAGAAAGRAAAGPGGGAAAGRRRRSGDGGGVSASVWAAAGVHVALFIRRQTSRKTPNGRAPLADTCSCGRMPRGQVYDQHGSHLVSVKTVPLRGTMSGLAPRTAAADRYEAS